MILQIKKNKNIKMNEEECILEIEKLGGKSLSKEEESIGKLAFAYGVMEGINKVEKAIK